MVQLWSHVIGNWTTRNVLQCGSANWGGFQLTPILWRPDLSYPHNQGKMGLVPNKDDCLTYKRKH